MFALNTTIASLILSSLSTSPIFQTSFSSGKTNFRLESSRFHHFSTHLFYSNSFFGHATFTKSTFASFLSSPIHIDNYQLLRLDISNKHLDLSKESEVVVTEMTFVNCTTEGDGGAIYIVSDSYMFCNFSSFSGCNATNKGGAIFALIPHLNFTQGCFNNCDAMNGTAVFTGLAEINASFEGCYIDGAENEMADSTIFINSRDVIMKNSNISFVDIKSNPAFSIKTTHWLNISGMTFYNLTSKSYIASFEGVEPNTPFEMSNFMHCNAQDAIIYLSSYSQEYKNVVFYQCQCNKYFEIGEDVLKVTLSNVSFDNSEESDIADDLTKFVLANITYSELGNKDLKKLSTVITNGCWAHSHYIWQSPKRAVQIIVGIVIGVCLVGGFLIIIIHHVRKNRKEKKEDKATVIYGIDKVD